jgi:hypothetical protein
VILAVDVQGGIEDAWSNVATFLPKLAAALLILIAVYFVAKLISRTLDQVLERVGFDRAVERGRVGRVMARSQYDASDQLAAAARDAVAQAERELGSLFDQYDELQTLVNRITREAIGLKRKHSEYVALLSAPGASAPRC